MPKMVNAKPISTIARAMIQSVMISECLNTSDKIDCIKLHLFVMQICDPLG
jgi:hypothetical protein